MKKFLVMAALVLAVGLQAKKAPVLVVDAASSTLTASVVKNVSATVKVNFPSLSGTLALGRQPKAVLDIDLMTLSTGLEARDANVKVAFFETNLNDDFKTARFLFGKMKPGIKKLKAGQSLDVQAEGVLELHGKKLPLKGPLTLSLGEDGSYTALLGPGWVVMIDALDMVPKLAQLKMVCPMHVSVDLAVGISGKIVFVTQK